MYSYDPENIAPCAMSVLENISSMKTEGIVRLTETEAIKWKCGKCGSVLCVHNSTGNVCKTKNPYFPEKNINDYV